MVQASPLAEIVLGLGSGDGYASTDITAAATAVRAGEVPHRRGPGDGQPILELRVHGVGGAPPSENLESPSVVQVAGDAAAGCYRAWFPGGTAADEPRREAYCWGKLNYQNSTRALWLMLLPFALVNVAHWALPHSAAPALRPVGRIILRLIALVFTAAFIATTAFLLADIVAWQAAANGSLWSWLKWYENLGLGPRLTIALLGVLAVLGVLVYLSRETGKANERWDAGVGADDDPEWPLSDRRFWCGERTLHRQRYAHIVIGCAVVVYVAAQPHGSHAGLRLLLLVFAGALALVAAALAAGPWADRLERAGTAAGAADRMGRMASVIAVGAAVGTSLSRLWWRPARDAATIPWDTTLQVALVFVEFALVVLVLLVVAPQRPARQPDVMGRGYNAASLALLACVISSIFGGAITLTVANLLGQPTLAKPGEGKAASDNLFVLPTSVYAGGLAFLVALVVAVVVGGVLLLVRGRTAKRLRAADGAGTVRAVYADHGARNDNVDGSVASVATSWATAAVTTYLAAALVGITVPTSVALVGYQAYLQAGPGMETLRIIASFGSLAAVFATGAFLAQLRKALTSSVARRRFGFFWDVVTFWPRACHPLGPPCYAERSIPELVTRVRRLVGGDGFGPDDPAVAAERADAAGTADPALRERHSPVLLVGYSQGSPICVATIAQLPAAVRSHVALLTLAAPVRRLYGRAFPAYFGPDQLARLAASLRADADAPLRWRNLSRRSDYIGGWALQPPSTTTVVDHEILDPPVLWSNDDPAPPPTHTHLVWFADPQIRPATAYLADLL